MSNIPPINKGIPVIDKATNFLSAQFLRWLQFIEQKLNKAVITEDDNNVIYQEATRPSDLGSDLRQYIYPNESVKLVSPNDGTTYTIVNGYLDNNGDWRRFSNNPSSLIRQSRFTSVYSVFYSAAGPVTSNISWTQLMNVDNNGNINIKTGSTYSATL